MIKNIASTGPKTGDKIQPMNEDRYFLIDTVYKNKAFYDWVPDGDYHTFHRKDGRYLPVSLLKLEDGIWKQTQSFNPTEEKRKITLYEGTMTVNGETKTLETRANTLKEAKNNLVAQFAKFWKVSPQKIAGEIREGNGNFTWGEK